MSTCAPLDRSLRLRQNLPRAAMSCPSIYCPLPIIDVQCLHCACVSICHTRCFMIERRDFFLVLVETSSITTKTSCSFELLLLLFWFYPVDVGVILYFFFLLEFAHVQHMCNWLALSNMFDCKRITSVYPRTRFSSLHFYFTFFYFEIETSGSHNHLTLTSSALAGSYLYFPPVSMSRGMKGGGSGVSTSAISRQSYRTRYDGESHVKRPNRNNKRGDVNKTE
jgi:hypothetical protein